ncbi:uncharacterized protein PGTG_21106 [Puccinia graminis f. sp. tritici CRL 75-36-700-3]|uniref:Uncharacterized protein n=1 Tax=Puccinia graminis f. sp. tritici (strain CRL 75-36-700-3 / race SCCL) TaxID=418459 RepID=H6QQE6_PUCGT|nr:uncharacterized protein PGTG_21106 [Puccinia graminis f. sp. tritici CRL 75-36-700-3]EHS62558.1 hypothetical protein PGTG_21106 [Puccinia graminis f. sp. tritici CRL 75-36-700-3]
MYWYFLGRYTPELHASPAPFDGEAAQARAFRVRVCTAFLRPDPAYPPPKSGTQQMSEKATRKLTQPWTHFPP